ncbi:MAG: hypothetical protein OHK0011_01550 [Turneriella sp.]
MFVVAFGLCGCNGELIRFLDEDRPLWLSAQLDTTTFRYSTARRTLTFTLRLEADRRGNYSIVHGATCATGKTPNNATHAGSFENRVAAGDSVTILLDDVATYGRGVSVCASDTADYQRAEQYVSFQPALDYLAEQNEATGSGLPLDLGAAGEYAVFQDNWLSGFPNRGNAGPAANSVNLPQQFAAFVDPNDSYAIKYFVVDMQNHRVLVFRQIPSAWGSSADVVIGQTGFSGDQPNANNPVGALGFNIPTSVAVSVTGTLYVSDLGNHRVAAFYAIPRSNGVAADFVIGQPDFLSNAANNGTLPSQAQRLNQPVSVSVFHQRLYVVDRQNHRVLVFNPLPTAIGPAAVLAIGQPDTGTLVMGTDYTLSGSYLRFPAHLAFGNSRLYISDNFNHRVLVFNSIPTVPDSRPNLVIGQATVTGMSADCGGSTNAQCLSDPRGIAVKDNVLAVADYGNNRVLFFDVSVPIVFPSAHSVLGQADFSSNNSATSSNGLRGPTALNFDERYIWISDYSNHRIVFRQLPY